MIKAYVNYPEPHITAHRNLSCGEIQKMAKPGQRHVRIDLVTISLELQRFSNKWYYFAAQSSANDMWLEIDFGDYKFEVEVLDYVRRLLAKHYSPFARAVINYYHC